MCYVAILYDATNQHTINRNNGFERALAFKLVSQPAMLNIYLMLRRETAGVGLITSYLLRIM